MFTKLSRLIHWRRTARRAQTERDQAIIFRRVNASRHVCRS